ncbi:MAG: type II toxin-antitoxin system VapC family toxin [Dehalococcoidia bacterium]|nr:type II toxin-antitoxin system VapC family toxin [Dehalococcoidia bacterium]
MGALLDTSVLIRYVTRDHEVLSSISNSILKHDDDLVLSSVVLAEAGYVLTTTYGMPRAAVVDVLVGLVLRDNVRVFDIGDGLAVEALARCRPSRRVSFGDAMTWAAARATGIDVVYSFDARFPSQDISVLAALSA